MNIQEALTKLTESSELYKGVFWIVDLDDLSNNKKYCFTIPSDLDGNVISDTSIPLNAKTGNTYNHEKLWKSLPSELPHNKPYNYYPRGRVEIANSRANIFLNPNINTDEIQEFIINEFNLNSHNIRKVVFISDGSEHYKCYLDDEI